MKYKFILISALMLLGVKAAAQTAGGRITGIVVDEVEDSPLTGATILIQELKRGEVADFDGKFSFQDLPEATYAVSYDPKTEAVQQVISLSGNLAYIHFFD